MQKQLQEEHFKVRGPAEGQMIYKGRDIAAVNAEELRSFRKEVQIIFKIHILPKSQNDHR